MLGRNCDHEVRLSHIQNRYFLSDLGTIGILCHLKIIPRLHSDPYLRTCAKITCQSHRCIRGNRTFTVDDLTDPYRRHANIFSHTILRKCQRFHKIFKQHFPWMDRRQLFDFFSFISDSQRFPPLWRDLVPIGNKCAIDY
nr:putative integron gene cassette protein [uncultured bacterium]